MSNKKTSVDVIVDATIVPSVDPSVDQAVSAIPVDPPAVQSYNEDVQARLQELRNMRTLVPRLVVPDSPKATRRLVPAASLPPAFIELAAVALANQSSLTSAEAIPVAEMRDLMSYAIAYAPLADELEAFAHFIRHSVIAARHKAGDQALTIYAFAQRLAKKPSNAELLPHVADMRRLLGKVPTAEVRARRAARKAAKAAAAQADGKQVA
ncbi:MAG TPA: hypothetical protein VGF69_01775 [Thermoanaerobaculia bacterium]|jgi:hypothetical protein